MSLSRRHVLMAGVALILITNAVALAGTAYNRSEEPEAILTLTQRELRLPYTWNRDGENSGVALHVQWRTLGPEKDELPGMYLPYFGIGGTPAWLDKAKLAALGFDVTPPEHTEQGRRHYNRLPTKEVLLVLEFDGPAYQEALARTRQHNARQQALLAGHRGDKEFEQRATSARDQLMREERENSRVFVIDAGLDAAALRRLYPDHHRHAMVRGQLRPRIYHQPQKTQVTGYISHLSIDRVNVPLGHQKAFKSAPKQGRGQTPYRVKLAFGKRLEPWILAVTAGDEAE